MKKWILLLVFAVGMAGSGWGQVDTAVVKAEVDSFYKLAEDEYFKLGNPQKALSLINIHLPLIEKYLGRELRYARSLNLRAICFSALDSYEKAEQQWLECLKIREKRLTRNHLACADVLYNLGINCDYQGRYEDAERFLLEAKTIFSQNEKQERLQASVLNVLGNVYQSMGRYEESEKMRIESLFFYENGLLKKDTDSHADILFNLGNLYLDLGNYSKAEPYYLEAKSIREQIFGRFHPDYIQSIAGLGSLYDHMNLPEKAESLKLEVVELSRKVLGKNSSGYANALNNLAVLYFYTNRLEKAKLLFLKAKKITEKMLGKNHPDYVNRLNNVGVLYRALGQYSKAKKYLKESISLQEKFIGKYHPDYLTGLAALAYVYHQTKDYLLSDSLFRQALHGQEVIISNAVRWQSEQELIATSQLFEEDFSCLMTCQFFSHPGQLPAITYDNTLFYKGFLLQAAAAVKNRAFAGTATAKTWQRLAAFHRQLAGEYAKPLAERDSANIARLEQQANDLEKELARSVAGFGDAFKPVSWNDVQAHLRANEAAIEFVQFKKTFPKPTDSTFSAALLLRPGWKQPRFVPLFEEIAWAENFDCSGLGDAECTTRRYSEKSAYPLYPLLWQPLDSLLAGVETIFYAPAGQLHLLDFGALSIADSQTLSDRYRLVRLGSTRQLISRDSLFAEKIQPAAILFGGVQYEMETKTIRAEIAKLDILPVFRSRGVEGPQFSLTDPTLRVGAFNYLPGTVEELENIRLIIQKKSITAHTFTGFGATEEAFKRIGTNTPPPRILHLATHGFFFPDVRGEKVRGEGPEPVFKISDHPMIRSGLALAGANYAWQHGKPVEEGMEDGILTAYEISQTNLRGTELVVLSACQTGLGDLHTNEGVYGLQRAFKIAGARYLVMSLQIVPDGPAQEFMTLLYKNWLSEDLPLPDAFRAAQSAMRKKYPDEPLNWAGWVLVE